jgi:hypothetical protein
LSAVLPGYYPTGRTDVRMNGGMGCADQTTKVRGITKFRAEVNFVVLGYLPNDGKVIEDARTYQ